MTGRARSSAATETVGRSLLTSLGRMHRSKCTRQKLGTDGLTSASRADVNVRCWRKVVVGLDLDECPQWVDGLCGLATYMWMSHSPCL
jgi:hypothetical protein